jgi:hypothetical protein
VADPEVGDVAALNAVTRAPGAGVWAAGFRVTDVASFAVVFRRVGGAWQEEEPPPTTDLFDLEALPAVELWGVKRPTIFHGTPTA